MRICVAGGSRTGKTTLAGRIQRLYPDMSVRHTDDLVPTYGGLADGVDLATAEVVRWMEMPSPWCIEGVLVARALRVALERSRLAPCELVLWLSTPKVPRSAGQAIMARGVHTVWEQIERELWRRGVAVRRVDPPPL